MRPFLYKILRCPACESELTLETFAEGPPKGGPHKGEGGPHKGEGGRHKGGGAGDEVIEGVLRCGCGATYPIIGGIPRMLKNARSLFPAFYARHGLPGADVSPPLLREGFTARDEEVLDRTRESFGYQWTLFSEMAIDFRENFLHYIHPLDEAFFAGKVGLDVGCGFGRHVYNAARFGAEIVGLDISDAIESARLNTEQLPNVHLVQADLYHLPFAPATFDFAYSIGVLHHLPDPETGYRCIVSVAKPGAAVFIWVYSRSRRMLNAVLGSARAVTTRLPQRVQKLVSLAAATVDWVGFLLPYRLTSRLPVVGAAIGRFAFPRLRLYSTYPFQVVWADWFDRLAAPVRFYYNREELQGWLERARLGNVRVSATGLFGWRAYGERPMLEWPATASTSMSSEASAQSATALLRLPIAKSLRILAIATNPETAASTRFRVQQWRPHLQAAGFSLTVAPFFTPAADDVLYGPGHRLPKFVHFLRGTIRRFRLLSQAPRLADVLLIHREAFPLGWRVFFRKLMKFPGPIIYDYDDAMFLPQRQAKGILSQLEDLETPREIMGLCDLVIAGNSFLADYARRYQERVVHLPTCIDTERFRPRPGSPGSPGNEERRSAGPLTVGWIGSHSTAKYLQSLVPVLQEVAQRQRFRLYVVGCSSSMALNNANGHVEVEHAAWSLDREVEDFSRCDIGIYPLWDDAWAQGKCGFKAIQFMACGVPVVAAAVGMNREIIQDGVNGFLATTEAEWVEKLGRLLSDPGLRQRLGEAGRRTVQQRYSLHANAGTLTAALNDVAGRISRLKAGAA